MVERAGISPRAAGAVWHGGRISSPHRRAGRGARALRAHRRKNVCPRAHCTRGALARVMLIGVDFDNTIVSYDALFHRIATERDLIPADLPVNKTAVRDHLRA